MPTNLRSSHDSVSQTIELSRASSRILTCACGTVQGKYEQAIRGDPASRRRRRVGVRASGAFPGYERNDHNSRNVEHSRLEMFYQHAQSDGHGAFGRRDTDGEERDIDQPHHTREVPRLRQWADEQQPREGAACRRTPGNWLSTGFLRRPSLRGGRVSGHTNGIAQH